MDKEKVREILTKLRTDGYVGVSVGFDGSGDSGSINNICVYNDADNFNITEDYCWQGDTKDYDDSYLEPLESLAYEVLDNCGLDWYNNDGGYGSVNIDLKTGEIKAHFQIRYTETNYYCHEFQAKEFTR